MAIPFCCVWRESPGNDALRLGACADLLIFEQYYQIITFYPGIGSAQ
jgi:hypothetical protein